MEEIIKYFSELFKKGGVLWQENFWVIRMNRRLF